MKTIFGISSKTSNATATMKFEKYLSKELAYDLLRVHGSILAFYSKKEGWIGANKAFFDLFKFEDMDDFLEYHESVRELFFTESEIIFKNDDTSWMEYIRKRKNGKFKVTIRIDNQVRYYRIFITHSFSFKELFIVELEDVTELELTNQKTKELENLKSKFLENISHEFRTPMNGIFGFVELLSQTKLNRLQRSYLMMLERSSEALMANIESLLDLSQMQSGKLKLNNEYMDILKALEKTVNHYTFIANEAGKKIYAYLDPNLPLELFSDVKKIEHVIQSLLQHCINYTDKGGKILLDIKALRANENDTYDIGFSIRHNGRGLTKEEIEAINKPFSVTSNQNLGIGLTLANEFTKILGGKLEIRSDIDKGTNFSFVLRLKSHGGRSYQKIEKNRVSIVTEGRKKETKKLLTKYLEGFGFSVTHKEQIDEGIFKESDFVYIIASSKDMHWFEELKKIKKAKPLVYVQTLGEQLKKVYHPYFEALLKEPLLPSKVYRHILEVSKYEIAPVSKEEMQIGRSLYALVVEDNVINQKLLEIILKNKGISIAIASDGQEAVEMAKEEKYDIIFMDIDMPKMDGVAATKLIKQSAKKNIHTPIVALTAKALQGDKEELLANGLDEYMSKPIQKEELEAILHKYFH